MRLFDNFANLRYGYLEVFQGVPWTSRQQELTVLGYKPNNKVRYSKKYNLVRWPEASGSQLFYDK